jgi:hypothetical protein
MHFPRDHAYSREVTFFRPADRLQKLPGFEKFRRSTLISGVEVLEITRHKKQSVGMDRAPFRRTSHVVV